MQGNLQGTLVRDWVARTGCRLSSSMYIASFLPVFQCCSLKLGDKATTLTPVWSQYMKLKFLLENFAVNWDNVQVGMSDHTLLRFYGHALQQLVGAKLL